MKVDLFWQFIWNLSEFTCIGLGRFAPYVFSRMIGVPGVPVKKRNAESPDSGKEWVDELDK